MIKKLKVYIQEDGREPRRLTKEEVVKWSADKNIKEALLEISGLFTYIEEKINKHRRQ